MKSRIRLCISQFQVFDDEMAKYAKQLGIQHVQMNTPDLPGEKIWDFAYDIQLENNVIISPLIKNINKFNYWLEFLPFYMNIEKEGVVLSE